MPVLSPVAAAILNSIQANIKNDDAPSGNDAGFQALLDAGSNALATNAATNADNDQTLMGTLYDNASEQAPVPQLPTAVYAQAKQDTPPAPKADHNDDHLSTANDAGSRQSDNAPRQEVKSSANDNAANKDAPRPLAPANDKPAAQNQNTAAAKSSSKDDDAKEDDDSVAQKIHAKIGELSDILDALAAMMNAGNVTQITVVQVRQTTLTLSQQNLGVGQSALDLSDRFAKLIAAVSASQNLPGNSGAEIGATLTSFQKLLASLTQTTAGTGATNTLGDNAAAFETDLSSTLQNLQLAKGDTIDIGQVSAGLQKLQQWASDMQALVAPKAAMVTNIAVAAVTYTIPQATVAMAQKNTAHQDDVQAAPMITSAAATAAPVVAQPVLPVQNVAASNTAVVTANAVEATADNNAGFSNNNSGGSNSGQNGAQAAPVSGFSSLAASTNANSVGASSFSKMLEKTSQPAPVAEQVVFNIKTAIKDGASKIQIQLDPLELGKLHIKIDLDGAGKATGVVVTADNKNTLDMLQRDARGLESALADAGIKTDSGSLSFNLRGGDQNQQEAPKSSYAGYNAAPEEEDAMAPLAVVSRNYIIDTSDSVNIQI